MSEFYDPHDLILLPGESRRDALVRHLTMEHGATSADVIRYAETPHYTLREIHGAAHTLSKRHRSSPHGSRDVGSDSSVTRAQKLALKDATAELGIELPDWVIQHSFLSDLRVIVHSIHAAHLARPPADSIRVQNHS